MRLVSTSPAMTASSQIESRGQLVFHASIVSSYVRGRAANHWSSWSVEADVLIRTEYVSGLFSTVPA